MCLRPSKPAPITTITMQEFPNYQVARNTKNSSTIICSSKFLLKCSGQLNLIANYLFPCLSPTSRYQFYVLSTPPCNSTLHQRAVESIVTACLGRTCRDSAHLLPLLSETEAALQTSGKRKRKSVLNPAHVLPTITQTQEASCIQHYTPYFCTLLLL